MPYKITRVLGGDLNNTPPQTRTNVNIFHSSQAQGLAINPLDGCLYVAVKSQHVILKVDPASDVVTVVAGTYGVSGSSGDGGQATSARLNGPVDLAFDGVGNMYIVDQSNSKIRKVTFAGTISTFMGNGTASSTGDGGDPSAATITFGYGIAITNLNTIWILDQTSIRRVNLSELEVQSPVTGVSNLRAIVAHPTQETVYYLRNQDAIRRIEDDGIGGYTHTDPWFSDAGISGLGIEPTGDLLAILTNGATDIYRINTSGSPSATFVTGNAVNDTVSPSWPLADGADGLSQIPLSSAGALAMHILATESGSIIVGGRATVWKYVPTVAAIESFGLPELVRTDTPGFNDADTLAMIQAAMPGAFLGNDGARNGNSLAVFQGGVDHVWIVGSSYSNEDAECLEGATGFNQAKREFADSMTGVFGVDFQNRGGGDGTGYGSTAPRIRVRNANGDFLVERHLIGSTVNDYAVVMSLVINGKLLTYVAGIRDISTKGAAFVALNTSNIAYSAIFAGTNAVLVHIQYPDSVTAPASFTPTTANCKAMPLSDVSSTTPIAP